MRGQIEAIFMNGYSALARAVVERLDFEQSGQDTDPGGGPDDINSVVEASKSEAAELVQVRAPLPAPLDQL